MSRKTRYADPLPQPLLRRAVCRKSASRKSARSAWRWLLDWDVAPVRPLQRAVHPGSLGVPAGRRRAGSPPLRRIWARVSTDTSASTRSAS